MKRHHKFLGLAEIASRKSEHSRFNVGCVIVRKNKVLVEGYNKLKTSPSWGSGRGKTLHAETDALRKASSLNLDLCGTVMYVFRKNNQLSKPCDTCYEYIKKSGIKTIIFSDNSHTFGTLNL